MLLDGQTPQVERVLGGSQNQAPGSAPAAAPVWATPGGAGAGGTPQNQAPELPPQLLLVRQPQVEQVPTRRHYPSAPTLPGGIRTILIPQRISDPTENIPNPAQNLPNPLRQHLQEERMGQRVITE
jgi:hypothetical protein